MFDLAGKWALVTGSSQGIGLALAKGLAKAGAEVVLHGRDVTKLTAATRLPGGARMLAFDVTDHAGVRRKIDGFEAEVGVIDILVNNAGIQHRSPLIDFPSEAFERLLQTNIASVFQVGQAVARHMIARRAGNIINIASVQTALARSGIAPFTATKGAVGNLTKAMAAEWVQFNMQCNAIAPGYVETELTAALVNDPVFCGWLEMRTPAGRWGKSKNWPGPACFWLRRHLPL